MLIKKFSIGKLSSLVTEQEEEKEKERETEEIV